MPLSIKDKAASIGQNERLEHIVSLLEDADYLTVASLSDALNVSAVTIRKDLTFLESKGYLFRTHGGASKTSSYTFERSVISKEAIHIEEKQRIAQKALHFIDEHDAIILASGTTMHYVARALHGYQHLTVLTSSLPVAMELCPVDGVQVIQMGGEVRKSSTSVSGAFAELLLKEFSCNKLFLGIDGISTSFGISTSNVAEASLNKKMIGTAEKIYVLGDSSKVGKRGFGKISDLHEVDYFITDQNITEKQIQELEASGVSVIIADD